MNDSYKRTFDAVRLSAEQQDKIRAALSSQYSGDHKEDITMNVKRRSVKLNRIMIAAAILLFAMALVGFAYGGKIVQLLGGGSLETGKDENGNDVISMDMGFETDPVEIRDGQIYFILDGSGTNITEECSAESAYLYEIVADSGYRHVVLIGGTPENVGWAEFIWDQKGAFLGSNATYNSEEEPAWLANSRSALY